MRSRCPVANSTIAPARWLSSRPSTSRSSSVRAAPASAEHVRILALVIVGRLRIRQQDRRHAAGGQLGQGGAARAADRQVAGAARSGMFSMNGTTVARIPSLRYKLSGGRHVALARLVHDLPVVQRGAGLVQRQRHVLVERLRAAAAAQHDQSPRAAQPVGQVVQRRSLFDKFAPQRIARHAHAAAGTQMTRELPRTPSRPSPPPARASAWRGRARHFVRAARRECAIAPRPAPPARWRSRPVRRPATRSRSRKNRLRGVVAADVVGQKAQRFAGPARETAGEASVKYSKPALRTCRDFERLAGAGKRDAQRAARSAAIARPRPVRETNARQCRRRQTRCDRSSS